MISGGEGVCERNQGGIISGDSYHPNTVSKRTSGSD